MAWRGPTKPNTNPAPNNISVGPGMGEQRKVIRREESIRRDTDKQKNYSITLIDVDTTIFTHLNDTVNPQIVDNGGLVKVPINYASPERWKAAKKDGYMRDKQGKIQCPAITYRRTTMQRNDQLITFNRYLSSPHLKKYSEKNAYDRFSVMNNFSAVNEYHSITLPDHVIINYDFIIWTEKIEQLNAVVEKINFSTEDYWGDKKRFRFRTSISDYSFQTEVTADEDRIVRATFTMLVYTYLLPESFEDYKSTVQKSFSARKVVFNSEVVGLMDELGRGLVQRPSSSMYSQNVVMSEISEGNSFADRTDFANGESNYKDTWNYQAEYQVKSGSVVTTNNGSGSSVFVFPNTSFNFTGSDDPTYRKLIVYVDNKMVVNNALSSYESGSSLIALANNTYSQVTASMSSSIFAYGNIQ